MYTEKVIPKAIIKICKLEKTSKKNKKKQRWMAVDDHRAEKEIWKVWSLCSENFFSKKKKLNTEKVNP